MNKSPMPLPPSLAFGRREVIGSVAVPELRLDVSVLQAKLHFALRSCFASVARDLAFSDVDGNFWRMGNANSITVADAKASSIACARLLYSMICNLRPMRHQSTELARCR